MRKLAFFTAWLLAPQAQAQFAYPLQVQANGVLVNNQTLTMNFLPGCTPTKNGTITNVTCGGAGGPFLPLAGGTMTRGGTGITQQWPVGANFAAGTYVLNPDASGNLFVINPNDANPSFYWNFGTYASGDAQPDTVAKFCWNCQNGGGLVDPANWASGISFERHFVAGHPQTETHLTATGTNAVEHRFISCEGHEDDNSTSCFYDATNINMGSGVNSSAPVALAINPTETQVASPSQINILVLDDAGSGEALLQSSSGGHIGSVETSVVNNGTVFVTGQLVRIQDDSNNIVYEANSSANSTNIYSNDHTGNLVVSTSSVGVFLNGAPSFFFQPGQFFAFNRLIYQQQDSVGTQTRMDSVPSYLGRNTTAATNAVQQQFSPVIALAGQAWATGGGVASPSDWALQSQGKNGTTVTGVLAVGYSPDDANVYSVASFQCLGANCTGRFYVPRFYPSGTTLTVPDFAPGAGFGAGAAISAVLGHDGMGEFKVTANGIGLAANATVALTFHDGTWTTVPLCHAWTEAATGVTAALNTPITDTESATVLTMTYNGVALTAGDTVTIGFFCEGT